MTREQLLASFAARRAKRIVLTWAQFAGAVGAVDDNVKAQILNAANNGNVRVLSTVIFGIVAAKKIALARAEVDAIAADDTLTVDELIALLS